MYLSQCLDGINLPTLSQPERCLLDAPMNIEELEAATTSLPKGKAPVWNCLHNEVYLQYGRTLLPFLIQAFTVALCL